jgi:putative glycosyltransferase
MDLSIVTTLYCSAPHLEELYARLCATAERVTANFEIVLVNDSSPDNSLEIALSLYRKDKRVRVIDLSRNFGHHKAIMTGLAHAGGDLVFLVDSDLEEEPELLEMFYLRLRETNADVVFGVQQKRKGGLFERTSGSLFYKIFNVLSTYPIPENAITARLMTRKYVSVLVEYREREMMISGLWTLTGFKQVPQPVKKLQRSPTTYSLRRKVAHLVNAITSFSSKPLEMIFYLGCVISFLSAVAAVDLIVRKLFFGALLQGWPSLIVSIWLLGGLTIFSLGVIGIYLSKIFIEVKQRPYTSIREVYEHSLTGDGSRGGEQFQQADAPGQRQNFTVGA